MEEEAVTTASSGHNKHLEVLGRVKSLYSCKKSESESKRWERKTDGDSVLTHALPPIPFTPVKKMAAT